MEMSWWSRFAPCTGGCVLRSHQQGNLSTECPFYLKSHPNGRKEAISEHDKKQRTSKVVIYDLYYVISGCSVLIFLGEQYNFVGQNITLNLILLILYTYSRKVHKVCVEQSIVYGPYIRVSCQTSPSTTAMNHVTR